MGKVNGLDNYHSYSAKPQIKNSKKKATHFGSFTIILGGDLGIVVHA